MTGVITTVITIATWLTAMPQHSEGKIVFYGDQQLIEANAEFHGFDLSPYYERCGVAVMSPADLGKIVWLSLPGGRQYGPCLVVDIARRSDFVLYVNGVGEIAEVSSRVRDLFDFEFSVMGEVYVDVCPPPVWSEPTIYRVEPEYTISRVHPSFYPYPPQQMPVTCVAGIEKH